MDKELNANAKFKGKKWDRSYCQAKRKFKKVNEKLKRKGSVRYPRNLRNQMTSASLEKKFFKSLLFNISKWTAALMDYSCFS